ncbi:MAG: hypothetical protein MI923_17090 [Phycisphaerales bacterium]|nr:hypothetical protein [Phycisphaerales bacterium]
MNCNETSCAPPPSNDDCLTKPSLTMQSVCVTFNNANASDSGVADASCGAINLDVWYTYTVPATVPVSTLGELVISTIGSSFDTIVAVYGPLTGSQATACADVPGGSAPEAGCNDDILSGNPLSCSSYVTLDVTPGQTYKIRVGSAGNDPGGPGQLNIDYVPRLPSPDWNGGDVGRCCLPNGDCFIVNSSPPAMGTQLCSTLGGFHTASTNFSNGNAPDLEGAIGCKSVPCPGPGEACWNAIDLKTELGANFGTITRLTTEKLYFKYRLVAGENFTIDTCGSDFNTFVEIFGENCNPTTGEPDALIRLNDDCVFGDADGTAGAARDGADCFAAFGGAQVDSCLCIDVNDPMEPGLQSGLDIIICIGASNPNRGDPDFPAAQNSIDPVPNHCAEAALVTINVTQVDACFTCNVDCVNDLDMTQNMRRLDEAESLCDAANWAATNNGGCSVFPDPLGGASPPVESINAFMTSNGLDFADGPIYICGTAGTIGIDQNDTNPNVSLVGQQRDNDYYELVLTERKTVTWEVLRADFLTDFAIFRQDGDDPCNLSGALLDTTTTDCEQDPLVADLCPGRYYLVIRALADDNLKPPCGSEYIMCLTCEPAAPTNCCRGDMNNDGTADGLDIQSWIQAYLFPNPAGTLNDLGGCGSLDFCRVDANGDGALTIADVDAFVNLLLTKQPCPVKPICDDPSRCQEPGAAAGLVAATSNSDVSDDGDIRVADNFTTTQSGDITEVCWYGIYLDFGANADCGPATNDPMGLPADDFTITYFTDDNGCPGTVKASFSQSGGTLTMVNRSATGDTLGGAGSNEWVFTAQHAAVPVTAGECCWIEIVNGLQGSCSWLWETSPIGDARSVQHTQGQGQAGVFPTVYSCPDDDSNFDLAFCLNLRITDNGCSETTTSIGRCCYGVGLCVETSEDICTAVFDGNFDTWDCSECCPAPDCEVDLSDCNYREIEQCGFAKNDGCNDPDNVAGSADPIEDLGALTCGSPLVVCGTLFATGGAFDTDFFQFTLPADNTQWKITVEADMAMNLFNLVPTDPQDPCGNLGTDAINIAGPTDGDCVPVMSTPICQAAGGPANPVLILVQMSAAGTTELPCGTDNTYKLTIECQTCLVCDVNPNCPVGGVNESDTDCGLGGGAVVVTEEFNQSAGTTVFSAQGKNWSGGTVTQVVPFSSCLSSSIANSYVSGATGAVTFDFPVSEINFYYVHDGAAVGSIPVAAGTATAFDALVGGNIVGTAGSIQIPGTAVGCAPSSTITSSGAPIRRVEFTGGSIDSFACTQSANDDNGGCNNDPGAEAFDIIRCGDVICGTTSQTVDEVGGVITRDLDWYLLELTQTKLVTYTITGEFDVQALIGTDPFVDCDTTGLTIVSNEPDIEDDDCGALVFTECLAAGTYLLVVSNPIDTSGNTEIACGAEPTFGQPGSHYTLEVTCDMPCDPNPQPTCGNGASSCQDPGTAGFEDDMEVTQDLILAGLLSDQDQKNTIFDDFLPTASGDVSNLCWFGFEDDLLTPPLDDCLASTGDDFMVTYYADGGDNTPDLTTVIGGPFSQSGGTLNVTRSVLGTLDGSTSYRYEASHAGVSLTAGTCVWIEIKQANGECFCNWFWAISDGTNGNNRAANNAEDATGAVTLDTIQGADMAFCVDIATDPASCGIIGACCDGTNCTGDTTAAACEGVGFFFPFETCIGAEAITCPDSFCGVPAFCQLPATDNASTSDLDTGNEASDDFQPTSTGNINNLCWWGVYQPNADGAGFADEFRVTYFADAGGAPDFNTVIAGPFVQSVDFISFSKVDSGLDIAGAADIFQYEAEHPPVAVTSGTCFWVEVVQTTTSATTWFWEDSDEGNGRFNQTQNGTPIIFTGDRAFCVDIPVEDASCP